jgi:hypothetical protein
MDKSINGDGVEMEWMMNSIISPAPRPWKENPYIFSKSFIHFNFIYKLITPNTPTDTDTTTILVHVP